MERFGALIEKKARLGIDSWGSTDQEVPEVVEPIHELIAREFPGWSPYPWSPRATTDDPRKRPSPGPARRDHPLPTVEGFNSFWGATVYARLKP